MTCLAVVFGFSGLCMLDDRRSRRTGLRLCALAVGLVVADRILDYVLRGA